MAGEGGLDGGVAFCCFGECEGSCVDFEGAAVEGFADELDVEVICSFDTAQDVE